MAKSRGRDVSITSGTLPLNTTRIVGISPLGQSYFTPAPTPIADAIVTRSRPIIRNSVTSLPTPSNRVAKHAPGPNNLYRPTTATKEITACQSRGIRREVIFATGKGGRNGMKTARFTPNSKVKCK